MNLSFNDDQKQLQDLLDKFIQRDYGFDRRRAHQALPQGYSPDVWAQFAEMGLLALPFEEQYGGLADTGGSNAAGELFIIMNALGRGLMLEPYVSTVVLAGGAISRAGTAAQKQDLLGRIAQGRLTAALALGEPASRYELAHVETTARRDGASYVLSGRKAVVLAGGQAEYLLVPARTAGNVSDQKGVSLFMIERNNPGVTVRDYRTIDGLRAADIVLDGARVASDALLGEEGGALPVLAAVADAGAAALCAEAVGVMEELNRQTLDYIKNRKQFGQPIGGFQVLQHRAVDMFVHAEQCKSMALQAVLNAPVSVDAVGAAERARAVSAAKVHIGNSGRWVAQAAIQTHGGMGMTNELPAAHYAKRLTMIDFALGDNAHHLSRFITASREARP